MATIPMQVLSQAFSAQLAKREVLDLVFLTFAFEPAFFEAEILTAFVDVASSASEKIRLAMLDEALRSNIEVAVYYDPGVLKAGDGSSKLPVRRIPVRRKQGYFHPKNVLALLQDEEADERGRRKKHLLVATLSANVTQAGWWSNVEACHIDVLTEGEESSLRQDVLALIASLKRQVPDDREPHTALEAIRSFLSRVPQAEHRSKGGVLAPRIYMSGEPVDEFLKRHLGTSVRGLNLEVISPYFDEADAGPLRRLIERFQPAETRVYLPRNAKGAGKCSERLFESVAGLPNCHWAHLPEATTRSGKAEAATPRDVHAKVYRFFDPRRRHEVVFLGSPNLTTAAHSGVGNFETGILVDTDPKRVSDWWLARDTRAPKVFLGSDDDGSNARASPLIALSIRYDWARSVAEVCWEADTSSPVLTLEIQTSTLEVGTLPPRQWVVLEPAHRDIFAERLRQTSFVNVSAPEVEPAVVLVLEEGMEQKPGLLLELTTAEILKYWALLTPEERARFHESRLEELAPAQRAEIQRRRGLEAASIFDTFAGIFHSFSAMEADVQKALEEGKLKAVHARLFAQKYDSLPMLLSRVEKDLESPAADPIQAYVIVLCAQQSLQALVELLPEEDAFGRKKGQELLQRVRKLRDVRERIVIPEGTDREEFFVWFEKWFLKRAGGERSAA
ncbi:hypothetical protein ACLESD_01025 [Pyxidicoccus sp. 3LFB2]